MPEITPPQSLELELIVLGEIMCDPRAGFPLAAEVLTPESFYFLGHGAIFKAMSDLYARGLPPDIVSVREELAASKLPPTFQCDLALLEASDAQMRVLVPGNLQQHARIVADKAWLRQTQAEVLDIAQRCSEEPPIDAVSQRLYEAATRLGGSADRQDGRILDDVLAEYWAGLDLRREQVAELRAQGSQRRLMIGLPTGFGDLDRKLRGLRPRQLIVVGAASSMGKTAFALGVARYLAVERHVPVVIFTLEMGADELTERLICMESMHHTTDNKLHGIASHRLDSPEFDNTEELALERARERLRLAPLYIREPGSLTVADLRAALRREIREHGVKLAIVDYLGFMKSTLADRDSGYAKVSQLSGGLKATARELKIPLMVPHQLSRAMAARANKRPLLSDLRDSGTVEQDADIVIFLYRDDYYDETKKPVSGLPLAELIVAKNRNGPKGTVDARWFEAIARFLPASK